MSRALICILIFQLTWLVFADNLGCQEMDVLIGVGDEEVLSNKRVTIVIKNAADPAASNLKEIAIFDKFSGERLGSMSVGFGSQGNLTILSVGIHKNRRGEELGPEAEATVIDHYFSTGQANRINAYLGNPRSISAHEKLGFVPLQGNRHLNYTLTPESFRRATENRVFGRPGN